MVDMVHACAEQVVAAVVLVIHFVLCHSDKY